MYGTNRNSGIRRMYTYEQALDWFNRVEPIRGRGVNAGVKPLGHRKHPHFQILKGDNNEIICRCYQTNVVTYMPDGAIKLDSGGYTSQTTAAFMGEVLGIATGIKDHDLIVGLQGGVYRVGSGLELRREKDRYVVSKSSTLYTHTVNRKVMNNLRKEVLPFINYLKGSIKIRGGEGFNNEEKVSTLTALGYSALTLNPAGHWSEDRGITRVKVFRFLDMIKGGDVENWYLASCWLAWSHTAWPSRICITESTAMDYLNELLIATNKDALIRAEVPEGVVKRDRYAALAKLMED